MFLAQGNSGGQRGWAQGGRALSTTVQRGDFSSHPRADSARSRFQDVSRWPIGLAVRYGAAMSNSLSHIAAVIFDMDGVLCDSESFMAEAGCRMFQEVHGVRVEPRAFAPFAGMGEDRYLGGVAALHGVTLSMPADKARAYELYLEIVRGRLDPLPGARTFISQCRQNDLKLAVASSADWIKVEGNLREIGLPPATFDAVVCGSDVTRKKPDPEIFLAAAGRLGLRPKVCVVVEDAVSGVKAARAAGCRCLGLTTSLDAETLRQAGATWVASDLSAVTLSDLV